MKLLLWVLVLAMALPALLIAVALGPVTVGVLCAVGFGLIVAGIGYLMGWIGDAGARIARRIHTP